MKRKFLAVTVAVLVAFALGACALFQTKTEEVKDPFAYSAYGTISTALANFELVNSTFTNLRAKYQVSDSAWEKYAELANLFLDKLVSASKMMADYKRGVIGKSVADVAIKALDAAFAELEKHYMAQIPPDQRKPLIR